MPRFSTRSHFPAESNALSRAISVAQRLGRALLDVSASNPTEQGLSPDDEQLARMFEGAHDALYDPDPFGLPRAREAIAQQLEVDARNVMLTSSTSEAYGYLFKLLCDPGDALLVPAPSYPLFDVLAQLERVRLVPYRLEYDGEWHVDASTLAADAKAILTVHPNNPTGSFLKRDELELLAGLGLPIISDEVFSEYALRSDPRRVTSALEAPGLVFRLGGLSKSCALPQLKLAWTVMQGPGSDEARARLEHIADAYLSPGTPVQHALPQLLESGAATRARILERVRANLQELRRALAQSAASVLEVEGGWYAIVRMPRVLDDEAWALTLLSEDDLIVQPGYYYELSGGAHLVLSLIVREEPFAEACARLRRRLDAVCA